MDGFERRKEQSKEDIRHAAWELFSQFGVDRVSVSDIARKAGVSQATIYNNFGSKEAIVREYVSSAVEHLVNRSEELLTPDMPFQEKMDSFIQSIADMMASGRPSNAENTLFATSVDIQHDPEVKKIREAAREKMIDLMLNLVEEGRQQKQVASSISDEALIIYFGAFLDVFINPLLQSTFAKNTGIVKEIGRLMVYGLRGEEC